MGKILNEVVVMDFFLEEMDKDNIDFLHDKTTMKEAIKDKIRQMKETSKTHDRIEIASCLWKLLFEAAMTYIDPNKQGYDQLFSYFDTYVEFEELIFASDSFYRDHTLHCIWVYFLGEYIKRNDEFNGLFRDDIKQAEINRIINRLLHSTSNKKNTKYQIMSDIIDWQADKGKYSASVRCITALTHDLGYPIKKISKINKCISKVLPYFSINNYNDFSFSYDDVQQHFVSAFLNTLNTDLNCGIAMEEDDKTSSILQRIFLTNEDGVLLDIDTDIIDSLSDQEMEDIKSGMKVFIKNEKSYSNILGFAHDFEEYKHGIMSAFLLVKNLKAFQNMDFQYYDDLPSHNSKKFIDYLSKYCILISISNHTRDSYKITNINIENYLTFIDELEEFSRISRASQNREFVEEFCSSSIYMEGEWLHIDFIFDNISLDNLDPERAFKGRCKRFLTLFDVMNLSANIKIRLQCIGKIPSNKSTYTLFLSNKYVDILIDGVSQDIPKYLKSNEFYTKDEYARI